MKSHVCVFFYFAIIPDPRRHHSKLLLLRQHIFASTTLWHASTSTLKHPKDIFRNWYQR
jgi:hypothetical protein